MQGLTLPELLIALVIVALLALLAFPSFRSWTNNQQTRAAAEVLLNGLRLAQSTAQQQNRSIAFCLTNSTPSEALISPNLSSCVDNGKNWFVQMQALFSDEPVTAGSLNYYVQGGTLGDIAGNVTITGPAYVLFNSLGRATTSSGGRSFKFANNYGDGRFLAITIDLGGQIRLCDGSRSLTTSPDGCPTVLP